MLSNISFSPSFPSYRTDVHCVRRHIVSNNDRKQHTNGKVGRRTRWRKLRHRVRLPAFPLECFFLALPPFRTHRVLYCITCAFSNIYLFPSCFVSISFQAHGLHHWPVRASRACATKKTCSSAVRAAFIIIYWHVLPFSFFSSLHPNLHCAEQRLAAILFCSTHFFPLRGCHCAGESRLFSWQIRAAAFCRSRIHS